MAEELTIQERLENIIEPPPVARKAPAKAPDAVVDAVPDLAELEELAAEPEDDVVADAVPEDDGIELEIAGETRKLSKAELKDLAEAGHTYKATAEALKAQREAVEQERRINVEVTAMAPQVEQLRAEGRLLLQAMQGLDQQVKSLTESDPIAAMQAKLQLDQLQGRFNELAQQEQQVSAYVGQLRAQAIAQEIAAEAPLLLAKLPTWKDPVKRQSDQQFIRQYMQTEGYPAMEIEMVTKSRYVSTLLKAAKYDQIVKSRASKKMDGAPALARPGTPAMPQAKAAVARMEYKKQMRSDLSDAEKAKIIQKRLERLI